MAKLVLIDGHHFIFRAFYGIGKLNTRSGQPSNALFGFASMLINILNHEKPDYLAIAFDVGKTFRHEDENYKAHRIDQPDELKVQIPQVIEMIKTMQIPVFTAEGFEADDVLGSMAKQAEKQDIQVHIFSGDRDLWQLINDHIKIALPSSNSQKPEYFDYNAVINKYGLKPEQIIDYKAIVGDTADNIKGVKGIGPKTASKLLQDYQSIENIYANLKNLAPSLQSKFINDETTAYHAKYLATIITNLDLSIDWDKLKFIGIAEDIIPFFQAWDFYSLQRRVKPFLKANCQNEYNKNADDNQQLSLF